MTKIICERCLTEGEAKNLKPYSAIGIPVAIFGFIAIKIDFFGEFLGTTRGGDQVAQVVIGLGLLYSIISLFFFKPQCKKCGSTNILPIDSPKAKSIIQEQNK